MRKKLARAPGANSSESTMIPPEFQGRLLLQVEKSLLDLFTDDVLQSVQRTMMTTISMMTSSKTMIRTSMKTEIANEEIVSDIDDELAN